MGLLSKAALCFTELIVMLNSDQNYIAHHLVTRGFHWVVINVSLFSILLVCSRALDAHIVVAFNVFLKTVHGPTSRT